MANTLASNQVWQTRAYTVKNNQTAVNVRHWKVFTVTGSSVTDVDFAAAFEAQIAPHYKALMAQAATWAGLDVQKIDPLPLSVPLFGNTIGGSGSITGDAMPAQVCGLLSLRTNFGGKKFRGRIYLPFPGEDSSGTGGIPLPAYLAAAAVLKDDYITNLTIVGAAGSATLVPQIWHRLTRTSTDVVGGVVKGGWATQRRRGVFGKANAPPT